MSVTQTTGTRAAASASHPLAARAAVNAMSQGGGSIDAVIAGGAVLCALLPQAVSLGGDGYILHRSADGRVHALNATGISPALASPSRYPDGVPERGVESASVPGLIGGWAEAHRKFGKSSWNTLFERAAACAEDHRTPSTVLAAVAAYRKMLTRDRVATGLFYGGDPDGAVRPELRQRALARSFRRIAEEGPESFYGDWGAKTLSAFIHSQGGCLTSEDFAAYAPEWVEPISTQYRGHRVWGMPPNSYGLLMLLQLAALEGVDMSGLPLHSPERFAALIAAARNAFAAGLDHIHDGSRATPQDAELLANVKKGFAQSLPAKVPNRGGTATITAIDEAGNMSVHILSVFMLFGSGCIEPETGILLQNRMAGFSPDAASPRAIAPHRRPPHTLCPGLVEMQDGALLGIATPGGPGQTLTLTQVLSAMIDLGEPLPDAIGAARWSMNFASDAILEHGLPAGLAGDLAGMGIEAAPAPEGSPFFGSVEAIERSADGALLAVADGRRDAGGAVL